MSCDKCLREFCDCAEISALKLDLEQSKAENAELMKINHGLGLAVVDDADKIKQLESDLAAARIERDALGAIGYDRLKLLHKRQEELSETQAKLENWTEYSKSQEPFYEWARKYLDFKRWHGCDVLQAVKTELLERDAKLEEAERIIKDHEYVLEYRNDKIKAQEKVIERASELLRLAMNFKITDGIKAFLGEIGK